MNEVFGRSSFNIFRQESNLRQQHLGASLNNEKKKKRTEGAVIQIHFVVSQIWTEIILKYDHYWK